MNVPDIVILVIVGFSSIFGLWRGFVREVLAVLAWIAAILIATVQSAAVTLSGRHH
jgi:membrane protein required for colicin V production